MTREYLQVTNTSAQLDPDAVPTALASLHKLTREGPEGPFARLNPFRTEQPVTFEFVVISEGRGEPVEFYYGADDRLPVLEQRLRSIYPDSCDIDRVELDLMEKLIQPVEYGVAQFQERLQNGRLHDSASADLLLERDEPIGTDGGSVYARPSPDDVTPYGVRWHGSVDRRNDWMTTLTAFSETMGRGPRQGNENGSHSGRAPLAPLIDQLTAATQPLAFPGGVPAKAGLVSLGTEAFGSPPRREGHAAPEGPLDRVPGVQAKPLSRGTGNANQGALGSIRWSRAMDARPGARPGNGDTN